MPYPNSKYRDGTNAEAHVHYFQTTWEVNHVVERLSAATEEKYKIPEFVLSLDGPLMNWYAQNGPKMFDSLM